MKNHQKYLQQIFHAIISRQYFLDFTIFHNVDHWHLHIIQVVQFASIALALALHQFKFASASADVGPSRTRNLNVIVTVAQELDCTASCLSESAGSSDTE